MRDRLEHISKEDPQTSTKIKQSYTF